MTDLGTVSDKARPKRGPRRADRKPIPLPNGDFLQPRLDFAGELGIHERTVSRFNLPTLYIGGIAFVTHNASLAIIAEGIRRRNQPPVRRRRP